MNENSPDSAPATGHRPGRGRRSASVVRSEALAAAGDLLIAEGLPGFTMEKVARVSGVSRVTLNRYWPSKGALALDAYLYRSQDQLAFRDTGNITDDLITVLSAWIGFLGDESHRRAFTQLIGSAQSDVELAAAFDSHYFGPRRQEALGMLAAAVDRGQLRSDVDLPTVVDMIWGACYHRLLLPNLTATLTAASVATLVATALRGIASEDYGLPPPTEAGADRTSIHNHETVHSEEHHEAGQQDSNHHRRCLRNGPR
ncbi:TetR/AcrR family transcriptional regulator [Brevibacterium epidermidis]|uniref:TetR/AcrR family transcriptional regulator n=1 Tax=Brevibacterium epidermidis TaxID=1698 RepID=UPI000785476B|nr:TetR/AcrR family transcriptional regulator [Brevibacterium epidermidis]